MSRPLPLLQALEEIRKALYPHAHSQQQFRQLLAADIGISAHTIKDWKQRGHYPQPAALRRLKEVARRAGVEIAGSQESYPQVTLPVAAAIDAICARLPASHAEIARRCKVVTSAVSHWRGRGQLPREQDVRDRLRQLAAEANVRIEGL